tara:strand:- start:9009 stop:9233 length:225 start_codon:yes stop_codon:yes gene_type:complete
MKGLDVDKVMDETPKIINDADKPLKSDQYLNKRVDINVLKARAKAVQDKENTKNAIIVVFFLIALGATGVYFSI